MNPITLHSIPGRLRNYLKRVAYSIGLSPTYHPSQGGIDVYRKRSSWALSTEMCPCDFHFVEFIRESNIQDKSIFHFGTGGHHFVGQENLKLSHPNHVMGITAAAKEHAAFIEKTFKNKRLAKYYTVLFKDIYTLTTEDLPKFDYISLFHLCEFYAPENEAFVNQNDKTLLELFISHLNPGGKLLFYTGSTTWDRTEHIVEQCVNDGKIEKSDSFKSIVIYKAT